VTVEQAPLSPTLPALLDTLRMSTGRPDLEFAAAPTRLSGGFYAEMWRFRLAGSPPGLDGDLVARIVPDPAHGVWEATIQRAVADQEFPTPAVRLVVPEASPLGRYLVVMDAVDGDPPMAGLGFRSVARQIPALMRHLPDQLAQIAVGLHSLDPEPLAAQLGALENPMPATTAGFVEQQAAWAAELGRADIAAAGKRLLATEPVTSTRVITHGDLHPFNILVTGKGPVLVDWTVARIAHPAFTLGFTDLMLANPPIPLPKPGAALIRRVGRNIARRFLSTYRELAAGTPAAVDGGHIEWHRQVHALRILVETAGWDASGSRPGSGHPWLILEPVAQQLLGLPTRAGPRTG